MSATPDAKGTGASKRKSGTGPKPLGSKKIKVENKEADTSKDEVMRDADPFGLDEDTGVNSEYFDKVRECVDVLKAEWPGISGLDALPLAIEVEQDPSIKKNFPAYCKDPRVLRFVAG